MRPRTSSKHPGASRSGKALVMFALLMPVLLGMIGLTVDGGLMLVVYRQTQNAADAAALAAAVDLLKGKSSGVATTTAQTYVQTYNNMSTATVTVNTPPGTAPHAAHRTSAYVEAIVTYPYQTSFIQAVGVGSTQNISARAVAGYEAVAAGEGVITLGQNPQGGKGIQISSSATLSVNGAITVNATGSSSALIGSRHCLRPGRQRFRRSFYSASNVQSYPSGGGPSPLSAEYRRQRGRPARQPGRCRRRRAREVIQWSISNLTGMSSVGNNQTVTLSTRGFTRTSESRAVRSRSTPEFT